MLDSTNVQYDNWKTIPDLNLKEFATDKEWEKYLTKCQYGQREASRQMGYSSNGTIAGAIKRIKQKAEKRGYSPDHSMDRPVPESFSVKGVSTYYDENGERKGQWVKSSVNKEEEFEIAKEMVAGLIEVIEPFKATPLDISLEYRKDICAVLPIADIHLGMLAWGKECGKDYDLNIAEHNIKGLMQDIFSRIPHCSKFVIENLGDYFHRDNQAGYTEQSHNPLDTEGRFRKMARVGIKIIHYAIEYALNNHDTVHVVNCMGNHDEAGSIMFDEGLRKAYEKNGRVTFPDSAAFSQYYTFGNNLIGCDHGHKKKFDGLPLLMAAEKSKEWGEATYRIWHTAHYHNEKMKEFPGCRVEAFNSVANRDAYAAGGGWLSDSRLQCILLREDGGEYDRVSSYVRNLPVEK